MTRRKASIGLAGALVACLLCLDLSVHAAPRGIAIFAVPKKADDAAEAKALQELMRQQLAGLEGVTAVSTALASSDTTKAAAPLVEEGYRALNERDHLKATPPLKEALELLEKHNAALDRRLLARTLKGLGVAYALAKDTKGAQPFIRDSLHIWQRQETREWGYTADVASLFEFVRKNMEGETNGKLEVATKPEGARVYVDGLRRGPAPLTVESLSPGRHWLELELDDHQRVARFVEVIAGESSAVSEELRPIPDAEKIVALIAELPKVRKADAAAFKIQDLRKLVAADGILVVSVRQKKSGYELAGWYGAGEDQAKKLKIALTRDVEMLTNLQNQIAETVGAKPAAKTAPEESVSLGAPPKPTLLKKGDGKDGDEPIEAEEVEFYEEWWFWTVIGGVVVVGALAAILATTLGDDDEPVVDPTPTGSLTLSLGAIR